METLQNALKDKELNIKSNCRKCDKRITGLKFFCQGCFDELREEHILNHTNRTKNVMDDDLKEFTLRYPCNVCDVEKGG